MAADFKLAVTVVVPLAARVPLPGEMLSQNGDELMADQFNEVPPELVKDKTSVFGLKGPPKVPVALKPDPGTMPKEESGIASAVIRAIPFGVPQPVQRS